MVVDVTLFRFHLFICFPSDARSDLNANPKEKNTFLGASLGPPKRWKNCLSKHEVLRASWGQRFSSFCLAVCTEAPALHLHDLSIVIDCHIQ